MQHRCISLNGFGSDPNEGREGFLAHYGELLHAILQKCLQLSADDPLVPAQHSPREATAVYIIGGSGGSSGGMLDPAITLANQLMRRVNVRNARVNVILAGPEMAMRDADRTTVNEQQRVVRDTAANNLAKLIHDHMSQGLITEQPPGEAAFSLPAQQRVWSVSLVDQSNGHHDCSVSDELAEIVALAYFTAIFTRCTSFVEDRVKDLEKLHVTGRGLVA